MKILFVSEYFPPLVHGGAEISSRNLAAKLIKDKISVTIAIPKVWEWGSRETLEIKIKSFPFPVKVKSIHQILPNWIFFNPIYWLWEALCLIKIINKEKYDLVHVQSRNSIPGAVMAGIICHKPVIATFRDWQILCNYGVCISNHSDGRKCNLWQYFTEDFRTYYQDKEKNINLGTFLLQLGFAKYNRIVLYGLQFFATRLNAIICISDFQKSIYEKNGFSKITRIYNLEEFRKVKSTSTGKYLIFGGRATSGKGLPLLLEAMKLALATDKNLRLLVIGGKNETYVNLTKKSGIEKSVEFRGWVDHVDMDKIYSEALAIVQPSVFPEPFGRMALEGLAHGIPVVVTKSGGLPEIIENGVTGYVVDPRVEDLAKGLLDVCANNTKLRRNIESSLARLKNKFESDPIKMHINLYKSLL